MAQRTLICLYPAHSETDNKKVDRETQTSREKNYSVEEHMQLLPPKSYTNYHRNILYRQRCHLGDSERGFIIRAYQGSIHRQVG